MSSLSDSAPQISWSLQRRAQRFFTAALEDAENAVILDALAAAGYESGEILGEGGFGVAVKCMKDGVPRVVKTIRMSKVNQEREEIQQRELEVMQRWRHANLVHIYEAVPLKSLGVTILDLDRRQQLTQLRPPPQAGQRGKVAGSLVT